MRVLKALCFFVSLLCLVCGQTFGQRLKVGVNVQSPPFFFLTKGENKNTSYDTVGLEYRLAISLAKYIAQSKKTTYFYPEFVNLKSPEARERALSNEVDYVINRYSLTKERKETIKFSKPYYINPRRLAMLLHQGNPVTSIGFMRGSTADEYFTKQKLNGQLSDELTLVSMPDQQKLLQQFFERKFDAIVDDREFLEYWHIHTNNFTAIDELRDPEADTFAIAISDRNAADIPIVNSFIDSVWGVDPKDGRKIWENLLNADSDRPPVPGIIIYPKQKRYSFIIPIFLGIPIAVTVSLILVGSIKKKRITQLHRFQLSEEPVNFAWIIANSKYEYKNGLSGYPYSDAIKLKQALSKYSFPDAHVAIQKDATRKGILKTLQDIACRCQNADVPFSDVMQPKDNLLIYFSGHGEKIQIGQSQVGFWIPVDGAAFWEFIPDYEIKAMLSVIDVKKILLISDSCFSGTLLDFESENVSHDARDGGQCIEIITAGNNRVPAESIFLEKLTDLLSSQPRETLSTIEIYNHLKSELTNHRHYQPQFGLITKGTQAGQFTFMKPPIVQQPDATPIADKIAHVLQQFGNERRIISYTEVRATCQMDEKSFAEIISTLKNQRLIVLRANNSIFVTQQGLNYGQRQSL